MDRADDTRTRRGEHDTRRLLVGKQYLPQLDPITGLDFHGRFHARVIKPNDGDASHGPSSLDTLRRRTCNGQIKPTFYIDHRFANH